MIRHDDHEDVTLIGFVFEAVVFIGLFVGLPALGFLLSGGGQP